MMIIEAKGTVLNFRGELQKPFYKNRPGTWFLHHRLVVICFLHACSKKNDSKINSTATSSDFSDQQF